MKISWQWLQEFVDLGSLDGDVQGLADALTRMGLAVEEVIELGDDSILDLEVTTNRPDCLNHLGVAREISAQFRIPLKLPNYSLPEKVNELMVITKLYTVFTVAESIEAAEELLNKEETWL